MPPEFITNEGLRAQQALKEELGKCEFARFAAAFVSRAGVELFASEIGDCVQRGGFVRVLAGEDFCYTSPDGLKSLNELDVQVKLFSRHRRGTFHPKVCLFSRGEEASLLVGSHNLTSEAFTNNVEASVVLKGKKSARPIAAAGEFFRNLWNDEHSFRVTESYLDVYRAGYDLARRRKAFGDEALRVAEPEVADAPERKPHKRPPVREMCQQVMEVGETLHYDEVTERVMRRFPEWEHGLTPEASIRRDLMQNSVKHRPEDEALFGWKASEKGLFTRLR